MFLSVLFVLHLAKVVEDEEALQFLAGNYLIIFFFLPFCLLN